MVVDVWVGWCALGGLMPLCILILISPITLIEAIFKTKTAKEWEAHFCENKIACADVLSFQQWFEDEEARKAKIVTQVEGKWPPLGV